MLHLVKLAVGVRDLEHLRAIQAERAAAHPPLCHRTRQFPRRAAELADGGSIYWVIGGMLTARQRLTDVIAAQYEDGSACAALLLDPALVPVCPSRVRAFQGWRYLAPAAAPPDLTRADPSGEAGLPPALRRELAALCLL
ncbi:MAG: DUF1489 family protein [Acetobacteraceae bacterium]